MSRRTFNALRTTFVIDEEYEFVEELGEGAYGYVIAARNRQTGMGCAIKKVANLDTKKVYSKRCLREIKLLRHFRHKNIIALYDLDITTPPSAMLKEVYVYQELLEVDLDAIIRSGQPLSDLHFQSLIYQILSGLQFIHSAGVLHCDIRPGNLLVNAHCELRICDFGMARPSLRADDANRSAGSSDHGWVQGFTMMSEYISRRFVPRRWYRAPELILSFTNHEPVIDIWSTGCTLAELIGGQPLFQGRDYVDQLNQIIKTLGTPSLETIEHIGSLRVQDYIRSLPPVPPLPFSQLYPEANPLAVDLLSRMLAFDPEKRISCQEALQHPYFELWHDPADRDQPMCERFDFSFEAEDRIDGVLQLIAQEVESFRAMVRSRGRGEGRERKRDSLSIPSREDILNSPVQEYFPSVASSFGPSDRVITDPSGDLERELAGNES